jgi:hypothetical protein
MYVMALAGGISGPVEGVRNCYTGYMNRQWNAEYETKMNKIITTIVSLLLLSFAANSAVAKEHDKDYRCHGDSRHCLSAPEIDPGQAFGALSLLAGAVAIVRGYRRKK